MHVYVLLDQPMPAQEAAEHVRRLLRAKPGAPPGQWCEILVDACRLPAGLDAARLDPATGAELEESPGEQLRSILQLRDTCDRLRVRGRPMCVRRMAQDTRGSFAAGPAETCPNQAPSPLEAIAAAAEARAERYKLAEAAGGERRRFGSVGPLPWDAPREIAQLLRSGSVEPGCRNALARAVGHFAHAAGLDEQQVREAFDAITFQSATWAELRGWRADCTRSYARGAELLRFPTAAAEVPIPKPDKLREIAAAELQQLPDDVRNRLDADAAEIPHRALRRAFRRVVGLILARCREARKYALPSPGKPCSTTSGSP